ncbi:MAG TPA: Rpn family recombination-promoting nuclease/putative transposase [Thermoanaerobaculia bacterium]|nr:Rpn family recombination-promoting nuclease/putative transposase [Thermoanaerobaculia bacterium]
MVESRPEIVGQHDLSYRLFFIHRRMIQDLLREIVGERWVERIDLDSGERVDATFVSPQHASRESDVIWKFRRKDGKDPIYVYILMEFQSRPDPSMPVRLMVYESLFYQSLTASRSKKAWKKLPLVIPMVVYNGLEPWDVATDLGSLIGDLDPSAEIYRPQLRYRLVDEAAFPREELAALNSPVANLFRIEASRDWSEVRSSVHQLRQTIPPSEASLRRAFEIWLEKVILPRFKLSREASGTLTLEEMETMLAERIDQWNRKIREEGRQEGGREVGAGILLRQLRLKFGPLSPEIEERVRSTEADRLLEWSERILTAQRLEDVLTD